MTRDEFVSNYCANSGITTEELAEMGLTAEPCMCDYEKCKGWAMVESTTKALARHRKLYGKNEEDDQ